jgi:hypothetical protein
MVEIRTADGKTVDLDCDWFADESVPSEFMLEHCVDMKAEKVKCPIYNECWRIYTRRNER